MGDVYVAIGGGGGVSSDEVTATKDKVLAGYTAVTADSDDEPVAGTMVNRGAWNGSIGINGNVTIPQGYHNGSGRVTQSIPTFSGQTIVPSASQQVVSCAGKYATGNVTVGAVVLPAASDIRKGVSVYGRVGTMVDYSYLIQGQTSF